MASSPDASPVPGRTRQVPSAVSAKAAFRGAHVPKVPPGRQPPMPRAGTGLPGQVEDEPMSPTLSMGAGSPKLPRALSHAEALDYAAEAFVPGSPAPGAGYTGSLPLLPGPPAMAPFGGAHLPVLPPGAPLPPGFQAAETTLRPGAPWPAGLHGEIPLPGVPSGGSSPTFAAGGASSSAAMPWLAPGQEVDGLPGVEVGHLAQAFREIDFDGHGFIGVSELRYLLVLHGERPTDEELDEMVRIVDTDGNGKIAFEDFCQLFCPGSVVHTELTSMAPEEVSTKIQEEHAKGPRRPQDKHDANLVVKTAAGLMYGQIRRQNQRERRKALPKPKREAAGLEDNGVRCRPGGPARALDATKKGKDKGAHKSDMMHMMTSQPSVMSMGGVSTGVPDYLQGPTRGTRTPTAAMMFDSPSASRAHTPQEGRRGQMDRQMTWTSSAGGMGSP